MAALMVFFALAAAGLWNNSPTSDEPVHLAAGFTHLQLRDFRMNPEHPPLVKMLAAAPLFFLDIRRPPAFGPAWRSMAGEPGNQWTLARMWLWGRDAAGRFINDAQTMFRVARIPILFLGLAIGALIYRWSRELWGAWGAAASTILFAFDPSFIAHTALVTTDVALAGAALATIYFFWKDNITGFIFAFALAQTIKFTAVLLLPIVVLLAVWRFAVRRRGGLRLAATIAAAGAAAIVAIWLIYGLRFAAAADRAPGFPIAETIELWEVKARIDDLGAGASAQEISAARDSARPGWMKSVLLFMHAHRLLPEAYLHGLAVAGMESRLRPALLNGEITRHGYPTYFLWTTLYKTPIPALIALIWGVMLIVRGGADRALFLLLPALIFFAVASASGFNIGHRHILQVMPFLYIACGSIGAALERQGRRGLSAAVAATLAVVLSSSMVFAGRPAVMIGRHLSYLNEIAGGPRRGFDRINDSNFDWGQDLRRLAGWLQARGIDEPIDLAFFGPADPASYGIRFHWASPDRPPHRVVAISSAVYVGLFERPGQHDRWQRYLQNSDLVGRAGYSVLIFRTRTPR
jgi:hypothetical protein